jgi:hypothetical protein
MMVESIILPRIGEKSRFCFVMCSLIRTFVPDHRHIPQWRAGVTFVGKQITALAVIRKI